MLEITIFKISTLLQRGFGDLGSGIVASSLIQTDPGIDLFKSAKKVDMIFSYCRIRQFTETTECLQDEIIVFVNKIVKIIHECARCWDGKPTKNFGERYLLTWRVPSYLDAVDMVRAENADAHINLDASIKQQKIMQATQIVPDKGRLNLSNQLVSEATGLL